MIVLWCRDPLKVGCSWTGDQQELVSKTDDLDDNDYSYCPSCEGNDFDHIDDEDDEV